MPNIKKIKYILPIFAIVFSLLVDTIPSRFYHISAGVSDVILGVDVDSNLDASFGDANRSVAVGDTLEYKVTASNTTSSDKTAATMTATMPDSLSYVPNSTYVCSDESNCVASTDITSGTVIDTISQADTLDTVSDFTGSLTSTYTATGLGIGSDTATPVASGSVYPNKKSLVAHFEDNLTLASGEGTASSFGIDGDDYTTGIFNKGLEIGSNEYGLLPIKNNLTNSDGTLVPKGAIGLWFKPSWAGDTDVSNRYLFEMVNSANQDTIILRKSATKNLVFDMGSASKVSAYFSVSDGRIEQDQWHYVLCSWDLSASRSFTKISLFRLNEANTAVEYSTFANNSSASYGYTADIGSFTNATRCAIDASNPGLCLGNAWDHGTTYPAAVVFDDISFSNYNRTFYEVEDELSTIAEASLYNLGKTDSYTSKVFGTDDFRDYTGIKTTHTKPDGTKMHLEARAGNTASPDETWNEWSEVSDFSSDQISLNNDFKNHKYFQFRLSLESMVGLDPPHLDKIEIQSSSNFLKFKAVVNSGGGTKVTSPLLSLSDAGGVIGTSDGTVTNPKSWALQDGDNIYVTTNYYKANTNSSGTLNIKSLIDGKELINSLPNFNANYLVGEGLSPYVVEALSATQSNSVNYSLVSSGDEATVTTVKTLKGNTYTDGAEQNTDLITLTYVYSLTKTSAVIDLSATIDYLQDGIKVDSETVNFDIKGNVTKVLKKNLKWEDPDSSTNKYYSGYYFDKTTPSAVEITNDTERVYLIGKDDLQAFKLNRDGQRRQITYDSKRIAYGGMWNVADSSSGDSPFIGFARNKRSVLDETYTTTPSASLSYRGDYFNWFGAKKYASNGATANIYQNDGIVTPETLVKSALTFPTLALGSALNDQLIYSKNDTNANWHTVKIEDTNLATGESHKPLYLDRFEYGKNIKYLSANAGGIIYSGPWSGIAGDNTYLTSPNGEIDLTVGVSQAPSATIKFYGNFIKLYGNRRSDENLSTLSSQLNVSIDGEVVQNIGSGTSGAVYDGGGSTTTYYGTPIFQKYGLSSGYHELTVQNTEASKYIWLTGAEYGVSDSSVNFEGIVDNYQTHPYGYYDVDEGSILTHKDLSKNYYGSETLRDNGDSASFHVSFMIVSEEKDLLLKARAPYGYDSFFSFTEHADDNTADSIKCEMYGSSAESAGEGDNNGLVDLDLPISKTVFGESGTDSNYGLYQYQSQNLETDFITNLNEFAASGILELGLHAYDGHTSTRGFEDPVNYFEYLDNLATYHNTKAQVWIDHGAGDSTLEDMAVNGTRPLKDDYILEHLKTYGYKYAWNYLSESPRVNYINRPVGNSLGTGYSLGSRNWDILGTDFPDIFTRIYFNHPNYNLDDHTTTVFDTTQLASTQNGNLTENYFSALNVARSGNFFHIYIADEIAANGGKCPVVGSDNVMISAFQTDMANLADSRNNGKTWVAFISEIIDYFKNLENIKITQNADGTYAVKNEGENTIYGMTLFTTSTDKISSVTMDGKSLTNFRKDDTNTNDLQEITIPHLDADQTTQIAVNYGETKAAGLPTLSIDDTTNTIDWVNNNQSGVWDDNTKTFEFSVSGLYRNNEFNATVVDFANKVVKVYETTGLQENLIDTITANDSGVVTFNSTLGSDHSYRIQADITAPLSSLALSPATPDGANGYYKNAPIITISASDEGGASGITTYYSWSGTSYFVYSGAIQNTPEGANTFYYYSVDGNGNTESVKSVLIKFDQTAPSLSVTSSGSEVPVLDMTTASVKNYLITAFDPSSGISQLIVNGQTIGTANGNYSTNILLSLGLNTIDIVAIDLAGNESTRTFTIKRLAVTRVGTSSSSPTTSLSNFRTYIINILGDQEEIMGDNIKPLINTRTPYFKGNTYNNAKIDIKIHSNPYLASTNSDENGNWSHQVTTPLEPGDHILYLTIKDQDDKVLDETTYSFAIAISSNGILSDHENLTLPESESKTDGSRFIFISMIIVVCLMLLTIIIYLLKNKKLSKQD